VKYHTEKNVEFKFDELDARKTKLTPVINTFFHFLWKLLNLFMFIRSSQLYLA